MAEMTEERKRSWISGTPIFAVVLILLFGCVWFARISLLQGAAELWVISDPLEDADAVAVLGGGVDTRPFAAADLYKAGKVKIVLLTVPRQSRVEQLQIVAPHSEINRAVLLKLNVAPEAIVDVGRDVSNTYEEALAIREWARKNGAKKIIIVTEMFPSRRVRWIFNRELAPIGVKVVVRPERNPEYDFERWWKSEYGIIEFETEVLKYAYYRLKY